MPQHTLGEVSQITASSWLSPAIPAWVSTWQTPEVLYFYLLFLNLDSVSQMMGQQAQLCPRRSLAARAGGLGACHQPDAKAATPWLLHDNKPPHFMYLFFFSLVTQARDSRLWPLSQLWNGLMALPKGSGCLERCLECAAVLRKLGWQGMALSKKQLQICCLFPS